MNKFYLPAAGGLIVALSGCIDPGHGQEKDKDRPHGVSNVEGEGRFKAGQFVMTIIDNASFFNDLPMGEAMPDLFLMKGTSMRVIVPGDTYSKVELDDGRIGYVMSAMMMGQPGGAVPAPRPSTTPTGGVPGVIDPSAAPVLPGG